MRTEQGDNAMAVLGLIAGTTVYVIGRSAFHLKLWQRSLLAIGCTGIGIAVFKVLVANV